MIAPYLLLRTRLRFASNFLIVNAPASHIGMIAAVTGFGVFLAGCDLGGGGKSLNGPCFHSYEDAVVHVESVRDKETDAPLDTIFISAVTIDGNPYELSNVEQEENAAGVEYVDGSLRCVPPFSFGQDEGRWTLTVSTSKHAEQIVQFDARYEEFHGGCPSWNDGGTTVNLELWDLSFDLEPFREYARNAVCSGIRNRLFLIDSSMVFSDIEGPCYDFWFQQTLWGRSVDAVLCYYHDNIAGPRRGCNDPSASALFDRILNNLDQPDLGIGGAHTVTEISF